MYTVQSTVYSVHCTTYYVNCIQLNLFERKLLGLSQLPHESPVINEEHKLCDVPVRQISKPCSFINLSIGNFNHCFTLSNCNIHGKTKRIKRSKKRF